MALRLRRGTDSERQLITPLEGELIYTTDTKILYIGDGVTQGGLQVTGAFPESIDDLADVDISSISPTVGQVLTWNGEQFLPADTIGSGEQINADIIADDSTILIDSETQNFQGNAFVGNTFTGAFIGDGSQLTNLPIATDGSGVIEGSNYRINIAADDSTIMVDTATNTFTGNFVGDGSGLTNLDLSTNSIFDLPEVFKPFNDFTPDPGDTLIFDGVHFVSQKIDRIIGDDSTILLDAATSTFTGTFVGDGSGLTNLPENNIIDGGTYQFNITGEDSQVIVDTATNTFTGNFIGSFDGDITGSIFGNDSTLIIDRITNNAFFNDVQINDIAISSIGGSSLEIGDSTQLVDLIINSNNATVINGLTSNLSNLSDINALTLRSYNGTFNLPTNITNNDLLGALLFSPYYDGAYVQSSAITAYVSDSDLTDSSTINSNVVIGNTLEFINQTGKYLEHSGSTGITSVYALTVGSFTTGNEPSTPEQGTIIFNDSTKEFQGWNGTAWVVLG